MLVIGHRGAKGLAPENTLESFQTACNVGADMIEFDVRLTSDQKPILSHGPKMHGVFIRNTTLKDLETKGLVTTLESILDAYWGNILLNLELKPMKDITVVYNLLTKHYVKGPEDWDNIIISSFHIMHLLKLRRLSADINLALLHSINPFAFVAYQRRLKLAAVGWHRLHVNRLAIEIAQKADIFTYVYTVNRPEAATILEQHGIDGVVTDYPDLISKKLNR